MSSIQNGDHPVQTRARCVLREPRTILVLSPNNVVHSPVDVPLLKLRDRGHRIALWTAAPFGDLHRHYVANGLEAHAVEVHPWPGPARHAFYARELGRFLTRSPVDIVFTHLQPMNFAAVLARVTRLSRVPTIVFRHHAAAFHLASPELRAVAGSRKTRIIDAFLHRFAEHIVTPGTGVRDLAIREGADPAKVSVIPYAYDFDQMQRSVDLRRVAALRAEFPARLRLLVVMRFVPMKRHSLAIDVLAELVRRKHDVNLTLLDRGPELEKIQGMVARLGLTDRVRFVGFSKEVLAHLAAADFVLCPSLEDASNSVIKEAGLMRRPVAAVQGVGDFDDYIRNGDNGFLLPARSFVEGAVAAGEGLLDGSIDGDRLGRRLEQAVRARFGIQDHIVDMYEALLDHARPVARS
jgi:glycosyltransferase involved in cell wall biosynthesis